ncbi:MAG: EAL domain-containing protein [Spirochaetales bacterium]|nr:EAL domain-containing protein [Spirochaetales bacterium]
MHLKGTYNGEGPPIIGLLLDNLLEDYEENIWASIIKASEERDVNLICFLGGSLRSPEMFHSERNILYNLVSCKNVDGFIAISGSIGTYIQINELTDFFHNLPHIPLVSIGVPIENVPSILIDNTTGMQNLVTHLIQVHKKKRIAFIKGPEGNSDADIRFKTYKNVLADHNIPFNPEIVFNGDFDRQSGELAVTAFCKERKTKFDALIAANDYMAISAIRKLRQFGLQVPGDIAVAGFDDVEEACGIVPALTTIRQPYDEMGYQAVDIILKKLLNREVLPRRIIFPTQLVIRPSCGCLVYKSVPYINSKSIHNSSFHSKTDLHNQKDTILSEIRDIIKNSLEYEEMKEWSFQWIEELYEGIARDLEAGSDEQFLQVVEKILAGGVAEDNRTRMCFHILSAMFSLINQYTENEKKYERINLLWKNVLIYKGIMTLNHQVYKKVKYGELNKVLHKMNQALMTAFNETQLKRILTLKLSALGIKNCYLALYTGETSPATHVRLAFSLQQQDLQQQDNPRTPYQAVQLIPEGIRNKKERFACVIIPLHYRDIQLGFIIFEPGPVIGILYETIASQISGALKGAELFKKVKNHANKLETEVVAKTQNLQVVNKKLKKEMEERRKTEAALQKEQKHALVILKTITDGVISTDTRGIITYLNPVAETLTGWKNEEAEGKLLKDVLKIKYNLEDKIGSENVDIVLKKDRGLRLAGSVLLTSRDGREYLIKESITPIREGNTTLGVVIVIHNVSEKQKLSRYIEYQTHYDILTGLYNRKTFNRLLNERLGITRQEKKEYILGFIEIESYYHIVNSLGDIAGDELLRHVTRLLKNNIRGSDILARVIENTFALILDSCPLEKALEIIEAIRVKIDESPFMLKETPYRISVNIGITAIDATSKKAPDVINKANLACHHAKKEGGNRIHVYTYKDAHQLRYNGKTILLKQISQAIADDHFLLYRQPIVPLGKSYFGSVHYEILCRMKGEDNKIINAASFIPAAEQYNLIPRIDRWVIRKLFSLYKPDYNETAQNAIARYSINLSGITLNDDSFLHFVFDQFNVFNVPPITICFEITETAAITNFSHVLNFIRELKKIGCYFALDDFGSGWTSFAYLKLLPVDFLKIDGSFVKGIVQDPLNFILVETINHLGHMMGLQTIAEYVENEETLNALKKIGVNYVQGFGIAQPEPF